MPTFADRLQAKLGDQSSAQQSHAGRLAAYTCVSAAKSTAGTRASKARPVRGRPGTGLLSSALHCPVDAATVRRVRPSVLRQKIQHPRHARLAGHVHREPLLPVRRLRRLRRLREVLQVLHVPRRSDARGPSDSAGRLAAANRERHGLDVKRRRRRRGHGRQRPAQSNAKSGGGGCVVLRESAAATTLGDESDARRTIDEVALASQAGAAGRHERDAAVREAAAIAKDVTGTSRLASQSLA